jgi:hypothetical protein
MDAYIDIFTDHYAPPVGRYGPMVAKAHGKGSMETETWFVNSETYYGADKAVTKNNALTLHPYWENSPGASTRWTLIQ